MKTRDRHPTIRAAKAPAKPAAAKGKGDLPPAVLDLTAGSVEIEARAAGEGADAAKARKFTMTAYTGGAMQVGAYGYPVVVDLAGMNLGNSARPILIDHVNDLEYVLGQTTDIQVKGTNLLVTGNVFAENDNARQVIALNDKGFKFQASIGARVLNREFVPEGSTASVNGQTFNGPINIARKSVLGEVSFVVLGADDQTSASIAAGAAGKGSPMKTFEQWLEAKGIAAAELSDAVRGVLKAQFDAEEAAEGKPPVKAGAKKPDDPVPPADPVAEIRATAAAESRRIAAVRKACGGQHAEIEAKAIEEGWDETKVELHVLRASRPATAPGGIVKDKAPTGEVLEAAMCLGRDLPNVEKQFKAETLEAAHRYRNIGLQELVLIAAAANGYSAGPGMRVTQGNIGDVFHHAFPVRGSGFSTLSVPGILSNVANKELLAGYMEEDQTWREIAAVRSVRDFKQITSYRLLDNMEYEELAPDGKIKHGELGEESYTRQAKTYAKMFQITRVDVINDDLGAFDDLRNRLGRGAAKKLNNVFWATFLANSAFFTSGRGTYITGSTTNLGTDGVGLQLAITAFRKLRSPAADGSKRVGNAVGGGPKVMLVPPELQFNAERLYQQTNLVDNVANANIHAGKYKPVVVDWLSDPSFTGYSSTAWYLLRLPANLAALVVSFLNGVQTPTVESAQADFNQLGIQFRGYHDFGVDFAEPLAGIKVKGAA